ncbi:hypothetical protein HYS28_00200 [Candidatus Uhrbacteria bacterium]|nr:hypothetical protein [Candidatus Uhrbacteria bacterium]
MTLTMILFLGCRVHYSVAYDKSDGADLDSGNADTDAADTGTVQDTDTGSVDTGVTDTAPPEDTGGTATTPTGPTVAWVVDHEYVTLDQVILPELYVSADDGNAYAITRVDVFVGATNDSWPTTVEDTRVGVGTTDQHVGVFTANDEFCGSHDDGNTYCSLEWDIDLTNFAFVVDDTSLLDFGFTMAFFAYTEEQVSEVESLHDAEDDLMRVYATVAWEASDGTSGETSADEFFTIEAE